MPNARGGRRQGKPGESYQNRTDMNAQPIRTAPSQEYGQATEQRQAQQVVPLPQSRPLPPIVPFSAPTQNPDEHVMAGVPQGAGPGPEALSLPAVSSQPGNGDVLAQLQALLSIAPNPGLVNLITSIKGGDYNAGGTYGKAIGAP